MEITKPTVPKSLFFSYSTPRIESRLHKAIYNGNAKKTKKLIDYIRHNQFILTDTRMSSLFLAIGQGHEVIADFLLEQYILPLIGLEIYFEDNPQPHRADHFWLNQRILVAFQQEQIEFVRNESADMRVRPGELVPVEHKGLIILCMNAGNSFQEVFWIRVRKPGDDKRLARIFDRIYVEGGEFNLAFSHYRGMTLFDGAACMNMEKIWWKMYEMFGKYFLKPITMVESMLTLAQYCSADLEVPYLNDNLSKLGINLKNLLKSDPNIIRDIWRSTVSLKHFVIAEYVLRTIAEVRKEDNESIEDSIKRTLNMNLFDEIIPHSMDVALKFLKYEPELWKSGSSFDQSPLRWLIEHKNYNKCGAYIFKRFAQIREDNLKWDVIRHLIENNWLNVVTNLYKTHDVQLFLHHEEAINILKSCLSLGYDNMVVFLLENQNVLTNCDRVKLLKHLITVRDTREGTIDVFYDILGNKAQDPVFEELLVVALKFRRQNVYKLLIETLKDVPVKDIVDEFGDNLLAASIWDKTRRKPRVENVLVISNEPLECSDSDDDETEIDRKRKMNSALKRHFYEEDDLDNDPKLDDEYNNMFNVFLQDGHNINHVNNNDENLLHIAVKHNNVYVAKRLIELGLNASHQDKDGNTPVHWVQSVEMLLNFPNSDLTVSNYAGQTPLIQYMSSSQKLDCELLKELLKIGSVVNLADDSGQTALHKARSADEVKILLQHGANINAKDKCGNTPVHKYFEFRCGVDTLVELLSAQNLDLLCTNSSGTSYLRGLLFLRDEEFAKVLPILRLHTKQFEELFKLHGSQMDHATVLQKRYETNTFCLQRLGFMSSAGFWPDMTDEIGVRALEEYSWVSDELDSIQVIARLILAGADWSKLDEEGSAPLHQTIFHCLYEMNDGFENECMPY